MSKSGAGVHLDEFREGGCMSRRKEKTFMVVDKEGGYCPIHGKRGVAFHDVKRHACGCPMFVGENRMREADVEIALAAIRANYKKDSSKSA
jgi:hypothetical protein